MKDVSEQEIGLFIKRFLVPFGSFSTEQEEENPSKNPMRKRISSHRIFGGEIWPQTVRFIEEQKFKNFALFLSVCE